MSSTRSDLTPIPIRSRLGATGILSSSLVLTQALLFTTAMFPIQAAANERHFTYTYETGVLPPNAKELEVSTTFRAGRADYYSELDHRLEFEVGVADRVMTAFYLNWNHVSEADTGNALRSSLNWEGVSNEWKWKLLDPVADPMGLALYGELSYGNEGFELEPKLLVDKKLGDWLFAANAVTEFEFSTGAAQTDLEEIAPEIDLGATCEIGKRFHAGLEIHNHNAIVKQAGIDEYRWEYASLFAGPVVSYGGDGWWVTLTVLPQLPALRKEKGGSILELDDAEKFNARLLFSFHL